MKTLLLSAFFAAIFASTAAFSAELFSASQRKEILEAIDGVCGDTWCEGDYNFRFNSFTCDKKSYSCELNFQFIKTDDNGENEAFSSEQVCQFRNIKSFQQLMDSKWSLNEDFYSSVTDCIWEKERAVRF